MIPGISCDPECWSLNVSVFFFLFPALQACYLRGLNSTHLGMSECRAWLEQWLGLSCKLQGNGG